METRKEIKAPTFYQQEIIRIREEIYAKEYLYKEIVHAKIFIDSHYADKIELKHIAGKTFFSKFHFIRLFKNIYGQTPYQYLKMVRIEKAKGLLKKGKSVTDVCFSVGFESVSSFTGFFKKITGFTPSAFQKKKPILVNVQLKIVSV
ncbi:MAG: AraC family transcriptional regulator [Bacteroidota bacterium]